MTYILKRYLFSFLTFAFLTLGVMSCGAEKEITQHDTKPKNKSEKELVTALFSKDTILFDFFSTRLNVDLKSSTQDASFSCFVKLSVDSAFGGSIKVLGLVFATYKVSNDFVIFVNKRDECYYAKSLSYLSTLFGTEVEFSFFQSLLLGLPVGLDPDEKYKEIKSNEDYILASSKRRVVKRLENDRSERIQENMIIQYHLSPDSLDLTKIDIQVPSDSTSIKIEFLERAITEGISFPSLTRIEIITPKDTVTIQLSYGTIKLNEPGEILIKIPENSVECEP
jgi:hypothetical protein